MHILVVDDNTNSLHSLCLVLKDLGHEPTGMQNPVEALAEAKRRTYPLIITDIRMPELDGLSLLSAIKEDSQAKRSDVVLITGHGDMATAVEALRKGAYDYLNKPINARELSAVVDRCAERQSLLRENQMLRENVDTVVSNATKEIRQNLEDMRHRLLEVEGVGTVIAESAAMRTLLREALILHSEPAVPVLIEGETGTGKEIFAKYVHYGDGGNTAPFMAINCAAIPHELFESELFGHEPGAYTGSRAEGAPGKLEQAGKGTLFLDEVAELPLTLQPKLLRVLEERTFFRVGGVKKRAFSARIICAGNRNMHEMVEKGAFRRDLYHRLRVGHLLIPPLRERREDILPLAEHFLQRETKRKKKHFAGISPAALEAMEHFPWPGNVRELENAIERAVLMNDGDMLHTAHIQFLFQGAPAVAAVASEQVYGHSSPPPAYPQRSPSAAYGQASPPAEVPSDSGGGVPRGENSRAMSPRGEAPDGQPVPLGDVMDSLIQAALERFGGNKSKAAQFLGISRFALHRRLQRRQK